MTLPEKFQKRIKVSESGCWLWTGCLYLQGYAQFNNKRAHRLVYEALKGPIPQGLQLDHLCRVRHCVNPDHLEPVTNRENFKRGMAAGFLGRIHRAKTHCPAGHEYNDDNTYAKARKDGIVRRHCRECARLRNSKGAWRHKPLRSVRRATEELRMQR